MTPFCSLKNKKERKFNCTCFHCNLLVAFGLPMRYDKVYDCARNVQQNVVHVCAQVHHIKSKPFTNKSNQATLVSSLRLTSEHNRGILFTLPLGSLTKLYLLSLSPSCLSSSWRPPVPSSALVFRPSFALNRGGVLLPPRRGPRRS